MIILPNNYISPCPIDCGKLNNNDKDNIKPRLASYKSSPCTLANNAYLLLYYLLDEKGHIDFKTQQLFATWYLKSSD